MAIGFAREAYRTDTGGFKLCLNQAVGIRYKRKYGFVALSVAWLSLAYVIRLERIATHGFDSESAKHRELIAPGVLDCTADRPWYAPTPTKARDA